MNKRYTILVDMDDTIEDLVSAWLNRLNKAYGTSYTSEDIPDWNFTGMFNAPKEELLSYLHDDSIWEEVKPIDGAVEYLKSLVDEGYEVYIVTATYYLTVKPKIEKVIHKYFPFIDDRHIIIAYHKQMIKGDILIDDYISNLVGGEYDGILFSRPHNKTINVSEYANIYRGTDWEHCYQLVHSLTI